MVYRGYSKIALSFFLFLITSLFCYEKPIDISEEVWSNVIPYMIPEDHTAKKILDALFLQMAFRILESPENLLEAGFTYFGERHTSGIHVLSHKKIRGFLVKLYLDNQESCSDVKQLVERCIGRSWAETVIRNEGASSFFIVPQKWLYLIPDNSYPSTRSHPKRFILIVEKMEILDHDQNRAKWKSKGISPKLLELFFRVVTKGGFADQNMVDNAPFCKNGKIAFIDTETHHRWPIDYNKFTHYLHKKNRLFWVDLFSK